MTNGLKPIPAICQAIVWLIQRQTVIINLISLLWTVGGLPTQVGGNMQIPHRRVPITVHHPKSVLLKIVMLKDWTFFFTHAHSKLKLCLQPGELLIKTPLKMTRKSGSFKVKYKERSGWLRTFTQFCINKNTIAADYMPFCFTAFNMCSFISLI